MWKPYLSLTVFMYICQGEEVTFKGITYSEVFEGDIQVEQKNCNGGDSIIHLTVKDYPVLVSRSTGLLFRVMIRSGKAGILQYGGRQTEAYHNLLNRK